MNRLNWIFLFVLLLVKVDGKTQSTEMIGLYERMVTCFEKGDREKAGLVCDSMEARMPEDSASTALLTYAKGATPMLSNPSPSVLFPMVPYLEQGQSTEGIPILLISTMT